ncbi:MAG: hypothetical protein PVG78_15725 [Desulfobacterales bacterium]|jgi:hypothetical protein
MFLYDLTEFLKLSSVLNYNLSAASLNRYNVLLFILEDKQLHSSEKLDRNHKSIIMEALGFLFDAYSHKRRRLGPMAVIHPIRAAALYCRAERRVGLVDLLSALFHDVLEDIDPVAFEAPAWRRMEEDLFGILKRLGTRNEQRLSSNLLGLTRVPGDSYYEYIGRLLEHCVESTELVEIKLADRLDNTLDMRIDLRDPLDGVDFFENIYQVLFVPNYRPERHRPSQTTFTVLNGARRLHQLFKNAVLLSLIRQKVEPKSSRELRALFDAVATASLREAQRTLLQLIHRQHGDVAQQRELFFEAMDYCYKGRIDLVTKPDSRYLLDGLFSTYFAFTSKKERDSRLDSLYQNKPLMIEASIAFITIFLSFLNDDRFYVKGISAKGIEPT